MNYKDFIEFMQKKINKISQYELNQLWDIYREISFEYDENDNFILELIIACCNEVSDIKLLDIKKIINIFILIKDTNDIKSIKDLALKNIDFYKLSDDYKNVLFKYIDNYIILKKKQSDPKIDYYVSNIKKIITPQKLDEILYLDKKLEIIYKNVLDYKKIIVECYNDYNYDFDSRVSWCMGRINSFALNDFYSLAILLKENYKDNSTREYFNEYYILGLINDLNYFTEINFDNASVRAGSKYLVVEDNLLMGVVDSIYSYMQEQDERNLDVDFIFGILKEGFYRKKLDYYFNYQLYKNNFFDSFKFSMFYFSFISSNLSAEEINALWKDYKLIDEDIICDKFLINMLLELYPYLKNSNDTVHDKIIFLLGEIYATYVYCFPTAYDKEMISETREAFYNIINYYKINDDIKETLLKYIDNVLIQQQEEYYSETNIENFYKKNLIKSDLATNSIKETLNECLYLYDYLRKLDFLNNESSYVIKNVILISYLEYAASDISFDERANLCIGLCLMENDKQLKDINDVIFNYYNNPDIEKKYKDNFFAYGVLSYIANTKNINLNIRQSKMMKMGIKYYTKDEDLRRKNCKQNKLIEDIAINVNDYWNDLSVKKHNKEFQLGIIYNGVQCYQNDSFEEYNNYVPLLEKIS